MIFIELIHVEPVKNHNSVSCIDILDSNSFRNVTSDIRIYLILDPDTAAYVQFTTCVAATQA